jgi:hypothetical protein
MKLAPLSFCLFACTANAFQIDDFFDRLDSALTIGAFEDNLRMRLSGTFDLEGYHFQQPAPGLIDSRNNNVLNPRLIIFLDVQTGPAIYFFAQSRVDRGFDPGDHGANLRLDECALRLTPWDDGGLTVQIGKFATVIGNWIPRHLSWDNPFINAPLPYENVTPISDKTAPASAADFLNRFDSAKYEFNPVIWGPSYSSGVSVSGRLGLIDYAAEMKNCSVSARPASWNLPATGLDHPSFDSRVGFRPNVMWNFGLSVSSGTYLRPEAAPTLPHNRDIGDYRELLVGQDISFAWRHLQLWAEFYEVQFQVPRIGDANTFAYYFEGKYKFTPRLFGALRWNQQLFNHVNRGPVQTLWAEDVGRIDPAIGYRFTSQTQLKLQYSFQHPTTGRAEDNHLFAAQFTIRF